jgi:phage gpG-like protein
MINAIVKDQRVQAVFEILIDKSHNNGPAMAGIAARMLGAVEDNFRAEGRPHWKALKASTLATRAKAGKSGKILQASGHLASSITPFHTATTAGVGTNVPYAAAMNNGSRPHEIAAKNKKALAFGGKFFKRVHHPGTVAREFMVLMDQDKDDLLQIMGQHLLSVGTLNSAEALSWGIR